jgi:hypothetical protein
MTDTPLPIIPTPPPSMENPLPIELFNNTRLRDSITEALAGIDPGHGNATFSIDNHGAGAMLVHRFEDPVLGGYWAAVFADRWNKDDHSNEFQVALRGSW